jgi:tetratricopeptide repeat protein
MSRWLGVLVLLMTVPAWAQLLGKGTIRVDVVFPNGNSAGGQLRAQLLAGMNKSAIAVTLTSGSGTAEFSDVETGSYYIRISGDGIETTDSDPVVLENGRVFISARVSVKKLDDTKPGAASHPGAPSVAVADLNVPPKAVKELESAQADMAQQHWDKALEHLNKAVAIYPQYSSAYNDLGVCYDRLGQKERQREALQKAVSLNERCVPALVNLAHMDVVDHKLPEADLLLKKAVTADPTNVDALTLQAEVDFKQGFYDLAIAAAHRVHGLPHEHFAIVHYTAASALLEENRIPDAIAELQVFLQEEPNGPRADAVRKAMQSLEQQPQ